MDMHNTYWIVENVLILLVLTKLMEIKDKTSGGDNDYWGIQFQYKLENCIGSYFYRLSRQSCSVEGYEPIPTNWISCLEQSWNL